MSYKHALALTAFGLGAVLQGCSEDDEKEPCTVNCEDKCKDITIYRTLAKGGIVDDDCVKCIGGRPDVAALKGVDDKDTDIARWSTALNDRDKAGATDVQKALPIKALQYCGATQVTEACALKTDPVNYVTKITDIDAAVLALDNEECGICHLLVASTDCATAKKGLTECGNAPSFVCEHDYSCYDIGKDYDDLKDDAGTVNNVCKTCLDAQIKSDTDITEASYLEAWAASSPDYAALADHLMQCGAEQHVSSCLAFPPTAGAWSDVANVLTGATNVCEVCVHMGEFDNADEPTCREMKTSLATCGSTTAAKNVQCPECVDFAVDNANCQTCLTEQLGSAWDATSALTDDIASYAHWAEVATCGADLAAATSSCPSLAWADLDDSEVATFQAAVLALDPACNACINTFIQEEGEVTCAKFEDARAACSDAAAGSEKICPECVDFAVDNANCQTCLTEQLDASDGSAWEAPSAYTDIGSYSPWLHVSTCGAVVADTSCGALDWSGMDGITEADYEATIAAITDVKCNACLNVYVAGESRDKASFDAAREACSPIADPDTGAAPDA